MSSKEDMPWTNEGQKHHPNGYKSTKTNSDSYFTQKLKQVMKNPQELPKIPIYKSTNEMQKAFDEILSQRKKRLKWILEKYGDTGLTEESYNEWLIDKSKTLNKVIARHLEVVLLIHDVYLFEKNQEITDCRAKELVANILEEYIKK